MSNSSSSTRSTSFRSLAVVASLGLALAGASVTCAPALASTASGTASTATTSTAATTGSTTDAVAQQVIGKWQMIGMSFDESAGVSSEAADSAQLGMALVSSMGITIDLDFEADGTYTVSMGSSTLSASQLADMGMTEDTAQSGTWYSDGEGIVLDEQAYVAFADDGTISLASPDGTVIEFASEADIEAGLFTPFGANAAANYLSDPDGFAYEWTLTGIRSSGIEIPLDTLVAAMATDPSQASSVEVGGSLVLRDDGTCTYALSLSGESESEDGTWKENADGTATLTFPDGTLTATIDDAGALVVSDATGAAASSSAADSASAAADLAGSSDEQMVFHVVVDSAAADKSSGADSAAGKAKADATKAAASHSSADADKAASAASAK